MSTIIVRGIWAEGGETGTITQQTTLKNGYEIGQELTYEELIAMSESDVESEKYNANKIFTTFNKNIHGVNLLKIVILSSEKTSSPYIDGSTWKYYYDVGYEAYYQIETPPEGWTGRAVKTPNNPLIEIIENSELTLEGNAILKVTSEGININGRQFTNEMLDNLI